MPKPIYIILGAPRSGMNLLAGCLRLMGLPSLDDKARIDASSINNLLLQDLALSWHAPALPGNWQQTAAAEKARTRIHSLLQSRGFLDKQSDQARTETKSACHLTINNALTLDLWLQALKEFFIRPKLILMLRHPWETALSLAANHNLDLQRGHILWLAQTRAALRQISSQVTEPTSSSPNNNYQITDNCLITYDQLLADPVSTIKNAFGSLLTSDFRPLTSDLLDYVQPSLKHHHVSDLPEADREAYRPYARLYDHLRTTPYSSSAQISENQRPATSCSSEYDLIDSLLQTLAQNDHSTDSSRYNQSLTTDNWPLTTDNRQATTSLYATITFPSSNAQGEATKRIPLIENQWQKISLSVPEPELLNEKPIIIKPLNTNGRVKVASIKIINRATSQIIWSVNKENGFKELKIRGTVIRVPDIDHLVLIFTHVESRILITPKNKFNDIPCELTLWLKVSQEIPIHSLEPLENQVIDDSYVDQKITNIAAYLNFTGEMFYSEEKFKLAAEYFKRSLYLEPNNAWFCQNLAEAVVRLKTKKGEVWETKNLSNRIDSVGKWDVAVRLYRHALKLDPLTVEKHKKSQKVKVGKRSEQYIENPVFIVGCGHSGTSILLALLGNHPHFYPVPKESALFTRDDNTVYKIMEEWDNICKNQGKFRWIEKTPPHIFQIHRFMAFRPKSQFILILRDGRDVICSLRHRIGYEGIADRVDRWVYDNMAGLPYWEHPQVMIVKYEDLILNPENKLQHICSFLNEVYSDQLLNFHKTQRKWYSDIIDKPDVIVSLKDHNRMRNWQINQPLFDGRGRWVTEMTDDEKAYFKNSAAQLYLEKFGYVIDSNW